MVGAIVAAAVRAAFVARSKHLLRAVIVTLMTAEVGALRLLGVMEQGPFQFLYEAVVEVKAVCMEQVFNFDQGYHQYH